MSDVKFSDLTPGEHFRFAAGILAKTGEWVKLNDVNAYRVGDTWRVPAAPLPHVKVQRVGAVCWVCASLTAEEVAKP